MTGEYSFQKNSNLVKTNSILKPNLTNFVSLGLALILFHLFSPSNAFGQLSGTKVIGSGGDYATFAAAVSALNSQGVGAGGVTFNVKTGTYNEQIRIGNVSNTSASNPVIFQSQSGNRADVTLHYTATGAATNYVVKLDSSDYVTFQKLTINATGTTYARVFELAGGVTNITIANNAISGLSTTSNAANYYLIYSDNYNNSNIQISGNNFVNGGWGIVLYGVSNAVQTTGTRVLNDTFSTGYGGVYLQYHKSAYINGNVVTTGAYGIQSYDCDDSLQIQKNRINVPANGYGITVQYCDGTQFGGKGLIANNFVHIGGNSTAYGIYLETCTWQNVYYNSVNITSTYTAGGLAFYPNNGGNLSVRNNVFANNGGGYAYYVNTPGAVSNSNYNDLYSPGSYLAFWSGDRKDLAAFKTASSKDTNSVSIYPQYLSSTDLHQASPWIDSAGTPLSLVTDDIEGQARDANKPDIGADEFVAAPSSLTPLSGTYSIGSVLSAAADYPTLAGAVNDLVLKGVSGPVTFNLQDGNYNEQIVLVNVPGASATNTITFQSQTSRGNVIIYYSASSAGSNYVVKLNGADYITIQNLTLQAIGTSYARVVEFFGGVDNVKILNNVLTGYTTTSSSANYYLMYCDNAYTANLQVNGNTFSQGGWGVVLNGLSNAVQSTGTRVLNDTFSTGYGGVYLQWHDSPYINSNVITTGTYGIYSYDCDDSLQIQMNRVNVPANGYGIDLYACDGTQFGGQGLIANNFVHVGGNSTAYGIYLESSVYQNVYYNSVNITSTYTAGGLAFYANNGNNIRVRNNIFANNGGGYAYYVNTPGAISNSNYNDLYSPGSYLAFWSGDRKDLAAFKTASSKDTNSVSIYPQYLSSTDLHQSSPWIDSAGVPLSGSFSVNQDIDGDARDVNKPDIGADEFVAAPSSLTPLSGSYTIGSLSKTTSPTADYPNLTDAVNALVLKGVSGPVTFNLQDGNYNEQIVLVNVPGASATNTITFQSQTSRGNVIIYYSATGAGDNYVVKLRGADYITFQNLTLNAVGASYARVFELFGGVDNLKIANNLLVGYATTSSSANYYLIFSDNYYNGNIQITGNTFSQGSWGVVLYGLSGTVPTTGTRVLNDTFSTGYGGLSLQYHKSAYVNGNVINPSANSGYGINVTDCDDSLQIQKNKINLPTNGYGIIVQNCDGTLLGVKGLTANNFVTVGGNSTAYGIYLEGCTYQNVYYNSANITSTYTAGGIAFYANNGGNINVRNNIFANNGGGYAYYCNTPSAVATSNYNDLYSPGNYLAFWTGNRRDLAAFQTASGKDTNSVFIYPQFLSATDLHQASPWLDSVATPITGLGGVTSDIDGDARDANKPDIGADEFVAAPLSLTPLSGAYSIGSVLSAAADYPTLAVAVSDLILKGVSAPVTFNIQSGSYNEQISLVSIPGASATNTVTFQSLTGNRNDVTISYSASGTGDNYVVKLSGADYLTFQKLTLQATGTSYARVFELAGSVDEDKISNNRIIGYSTTSGSNQYALVYSDNSYTSNIQINDNTLGQGGWGVIMVGVSNVVQSTGTRVTIDTFVTGYGGVYLQYQDSPYANGNVITSNSRGIEVYDCDDSLQIQKNKISVTNPGYGVYLYACDGTLLGGKGLLSNNFVHVGGTSTAYGFYIESSTYQNLYYNSVNITSTYTAGGIAFYPNNGGNINAVNNVFANSGGGYTYYVSTPSAVATSNYNDFYTTGTNLAYWTGDRTDLAALKAVSGKDVNSISVNPKFPSNINLHTGQLLLDSTGTPLALVTEDIDGEIRDLNRPEIGADEFYCQAKPGDADGNNQILLPDIIRIINFLFKSQPAPTPLCRGDANADGKILLPDIIYIVNFLFKAGAAPVKVPVCCL